LRFSLLLLLFAAAALFFVDLGGSSIWDANEAFYAETPREMIERGDYISPTFNYEPRLNKPVLSYWIVAAFYRVFGVSVAVERFAIGVGALVIVAAAFFLARAAFPTSGALRLEPTTAGLWAALGLAVAPRLVMFARRIFIDVYVSMFMALTLLFFALAERHPERRRVFLTLMYVSVGLGVLTKGPVAALLPGLVFAIYLIVQRELRRTREMMIPAGVVIVLAIVVPWYAALYARDGWTYISAFFLGENLDRFTEGVGVNADRGPLFYLPVIFTDSFPISLFLPAAAAAWFADRRANPDPAFRIRTLLWIWIVAIVGFFSISAAKQDLYVFPIVPAAAALGGVAIVRAPGSRSVRATTAVFGIVLLILGAGMIYLFAGSGSVYAVKGTMAMGALGIAGGIAGLVLAIRSRINQALYALAIAVVAMNWTFVVRLLPSFEAYKPAPAFARILATRVSAKDVVATYNVALPSLVFYMQRRVEMAYDAAPISKFLESRSATYVILSERDYEALRELTAAPTCVIARQPTFDVKLRNILARQPLPDLVLISNRCASTPNSQLPTPKQPVS
jgi:4-amino-4-deoxy-L-arabinose transferase-like glycosyltransferase